MSYASTGTSLSDKTRYELFARTVPPDTFQALALVHVVESFAWSYVSIVSSEGQYGDSGMKAFLQEARARNVCIAVNVKVPYSAQEAAFDAVFAHLLTKPSARAVVLFVRMEDARGILAAAARASAPDFFTWVASDGWGKEDKLVRGLEAVAEGAITVELQTTRIPEFDAYMAALTPASNARNPWFPEYWQQLFSCRLTPAPDDAAAAATDPPFESLCDPRLRLNMSREGYTQETKVQFVVDAVYAFAHALHAAWSDLCAGRPAAACLPLKQLDGRTFYSRYLLRVNFTGSFLPSCLCVCASHCCCCG